jgi:hypothetical protein
VLGHDARLRADWLEPEVDFGCLLVREAGGMPLEGQLGRRIPQRDPTNLVLAAAGC